jgi:hypothetical protein
MTLRQLVDETMGHLETLNVPVYLRNQLDVETTPTGEKVYVPPDEEEYLTVDAPQVSDFRDFDTFYSAVGLQVTAWTQHPGATFDLIERVRELMVTNGWQVEGAQPLDDPPFSGFAAIFRQIH